MFTFMPWSLGEILQVIIYITSMKEDKTVTNTHIPEVCLHHTDRM